MIPLFLSALLSCADGAWILEGIYKSDHLTLTQRNELVAEIVAVMPEDCQADSLE